MMREGIKQRVDSLNEFRAAWGLEHILVIDRETKD
jgi:hypothetical protein